MVRRCRILVSFSLFAFLSGFAPGGAFAAVPYPPNCSVAACLPLCPAGDREFTVVVRDFFNQPVGNVVVSVSLDNCPAPSTAQCADCPSGSEYNPPNREFRALANAGGIATFRICGSITCPAYEGQRWVQVFALGVIIGSCTFANADLDADGEVDAQDVAIVTAAQGGTLAQADQDCDHAIDAADVAVVEAHRGHACPGVVASRAATWGKMKGLYR